MYRRYYYHDKQTEKHLQVVGWNQLQFKLQCNGWICDLICMICKYIEYLENYGNVQVMYDTENKIEL